MSEKKDSSQMLQIHKRQVSLISGGLVLLAAGIFAGGYFLGTYHAVESFMVKAEQDSFADQVYASLSALYDQDGSTIKPETAESVEVEAIEVAQPVKENRNNNSESLINEMPLLNQEQAQEQVPVSQETVSEPAQKIDDEDTQKESVDSFELVKNEKNNKRWRAQLIGYGLEESARKFAQKLTKKGFDVAVTARTSRSANGRQRTWYQVVTAACDNRDLLQKQVDKIVSLEKLKGVQISIC